MTSLVASQLNNVCYRQTIDPNFCTHAEAVYREDLDCDGDCVADLMLVTLRAGATEPSCAHQARAALSYA